MKNRILIEAEAALKQQHAQHLAIIEGGFESLMKAEAVNHERVMKGLEAMRAHQIGALNEQFGVEEAVE